MKTNTCAMFLILSDI